MPADERRARLAPTIRTAVGIVALDLAIVVALVMLIDGGAVRGIDQAVIGAVRARALVAPLGWLGTATELGSTWWVAILAAAVALVEIAARRLWLGLAAAGTIGLASLANSAIKIVVERPRPDQLPPLVVEPGYSFPSGHSLSAMVAYGVIAVLVARTSLPAWLRVVAIAGLGTLIGVVGLSRVYLGAHYPSDVVGGYLVGLAGVVIFATLSTLIDPRVPASMGPRAARGQRGDGAS
jgi:membrane-associated phospholipid phosphatase